MAVPFFMSEAVNFFSKCKVKIEQLNVGLEEYDQISFTYYIFSSQTAIRVAILTFLSVLFTFMLLALFIYQIKFITLGFTSQFPPPPMYNKLNVNLKNWPSALSHRFKNAFIFFFKSAEQNANIYTAYKKEHSKMMAIHKPVLSYPRDEKENTTSELLDINPLKNNLPKDSIVNNLKQYEIDLD